jgi:hypothetical protein
MARLRTKSMAANRDSIRPVQVRAAQRSTRSEPAPTLVAIPEIGICDSAADPGKLIVLRPI